MDTTVVDNSKKTIHVMMWIGNCLDLQQGEGGLFFFQRAVQTEYMFLVVDPLLLDVSSCDW